MKKKIFLAGLLTLLLVGCETEINPSDFISSGNSTYSSVQGNSGSSSSSSSSSLGSIPSKDSKWDVNFEEYGQTFRNTLQACMASKKSLSPSYDANKTIGPAAAAYPNKNSNTFVPFYHTTDTLVTYSSCNREHTWPQSRGAKEGTRPGNDPFMVRPTISTENSNRSNASYGYTTEGCWDPACFGFEGARGESARVALYAATLYGGPASGYDFKLQLSNSTSTNNNNMGMLKTILAWNRAYPVTDMEKQINNYLSDNGYGRNPFVDHPEYSQFIWNDTGFVTSKVTGIDTSTDIDGGGTKVEVTPTHTLVSNIDDITKYPLAIVTNLPSTNTYYGMTKSAKSDTLPWYIEGIPCDLTDDKTGMAPEGTTLTTFTFAKQTDGSYTIKNNETNNYLYNYTSGTHYSISYSSSVTNDSNISNKWTLTQSGNGFTFKGASNNVYLEYYNGSFTGYKSNPNTPVLLYKAK